MAQLFTNNALTTLGTAIGTSDASLTVATGTGSLFASPTAGDFQLVTLSDPNYTTFEIVKVTARSGDVLTIVRSQEGTTAQTWGVGSKVYAGVTVGTLAGIAFLSNPATITGLWNFTTAPTIGGVSIVTTGGALFTGTIQAPGFLGPLSGNASTASVLATPRTIGLSGVTATATGFDGSANITIPVTAIPTSLLTGTLVAAQFPALTGAITTTAGSFATTLSAGAVALANMANLAATSLIGNSTVSAATPAAITIGSGLSLSGGVLSSTAGGGSVTSISIVTANGFSGTVATATSTPAITLQTSITGVLKGNGTAISAAVVGTDYSVGTSALATGILKSTTTTGALSIAVAADFPTLNQSTTGNASTATVLATSRTIGMSGVTATATGFNGSANITIPVTAVPTSLLTGTLLAARMPAFTGDVTTSAGAVATTISAGVVTLAKMATLAATSLIGNGTASAATPTAITIGSGLSLTGGVLSATGSGGMTNPMTTLGDLIIGGSGGAPTRLAATTNSYVLTLVSGSPAWAAATGGASLGSTVTNIASASGTLTLDCSLGDYFITTLIESVTTFTLTNPPASSTGRTISLLVYQNVTGGNTFALPSSFKPIGNSNTAIQSAANSLTLLVFSTLDGGTTWKYSMGATT